MGVYNHQYQLFKGPFTPVWTRFLIIPRYAFKRVFASRLFTGFYVLCYLPLLIFGSMFYVYHNSGIIEMMNIQQDWIQIDADFFMQIIHVQTGVAFLVTLFLGPPLISPDLTDNALPLYLSRPFERRDYVIGKFAVIYLLTSGVTWVSSTLLFITQASMAGGTWFLDHFRILIGIFFSANIYIITIALLALALSAWLKWKTVAGFAMITLPLIALGMGAALDETLNIHWGKYLNMDRITDTIYSFFFGLPYSNSMSLGGCFFIVAFVAVISLLLLRIRIKAYEVIR